MGPGATRRAFLSVVGGGSLATSGCLARFGGFDDANSLERTDLFVSDTGEYRRYRIPALLVSGEGSLLAFCEGRRGTGDDRSPTDVLVRRSTDGGRTWSEQQVVHSEGNATISNPTPVLDRSTGAIHLPICRNYRDVLVTRSTDDGRTWLEPTEITDAVKREDWGYYAFGPGVGVQLRRPPYRGRLLVPATHWRHLWDGEIPPDTVMYDHVIYSDDGGATWTLGPTVAAHVDEPQVVELADGRVMLNMRRSPNTPSDRPSNRRAVAVGRDGGTTWGDVTYDERLVTPTCQASVVRYSWPEDGRSRILFSNPAHAEGRTDLTIRLSYDEAESWSHSKLLYGSRAAYSCLATLPDGSVGCLFERGDPFGPTYKRLTFCRLTIEWLTEGADVPR